MSARSIFEDLKSRRWDPINDWVSNREPESVHFDFKRKLNPATYRLDDNDRFNIAKALSGFANSSGGVLLLGVARIDGKDRDDPDLVGPVVPIAQVRRFLECLDREAASLTDPPIAGLDFLALENPEGNGSGVVAIFVPHSDAVPHRVLKGGNDYYIRIGTRTVPMTHQLLAEQFGRRPFPNLRLAVVFDGAARALVLRLHNFGRGTARQPAIYFDRPDKDFEWYASLAHHWSIAKRLGPNDGITYQSDANVIVYPASQIDVGKVQVVDNRVPPKSIALRGRLYCVEAIPVAFERNVPEGQEALLPVEADDSARLI